MSAPETAHSGGVNQRFSEHTLGVLACVLSRLRGAAGSSAQSVVACPSPVLQIARVGAGPVCGGGADGLLLLGPRAAGSP